MIYHWSKYKDIEELNPKISGSIPSDSFLSQYHKIFTGNNNEIYIQSPITTVRNRNKKWLYLRLCIEETKNLQFVNSCTKIFKKIQNKVQKKYKKTIIWNDFTNYRSGNYIGINCMLSNNCVLYDSSKNIIQIDDSIINNSIVDIIFGVNCADIVSPMDDDTSLYGRIFLNVLQLRIHNFKNTPIGEYAFVDVEKTKTVDKNNIYYKYFDMIRKGVPRPAVEQRMLLEGVDVSILDTDVDKLNDKLNANSKDIIPKKLLFTDAELKNTKLKKAPKNSNKKKAPKRGIHLGISFEDIQNTLKSLRKTNLLSFSNDS
tara:strand:- start:8620 stop:9564 length:945 start_codon:yes stop_codon:yes gene_type:complete